MKQNYIFMIAFLTVVFFIPGCFSNLQLRSETSERVRPERTVEQIMSQETEVIEETEHIEETDQIQTAYPETETFESEAVVSITERIHQEWGVRVASEEYVLDLGDTIDLNGIEVTLEEIYITQDEDGTTLLFDLWRVRNNTGSSVNVWHNISLAMFSGPGNYALTYISGYEIYPPATSIVDVQSLSQGDSRTIYTFPNRYVGEGYYLIEAAAIDPNTGLSIDQAYFYLVWISVVD